MLNLTIQYLLDKVRSVSIISVVLFSFHLIFMNEVFASEPRDVRVSNLGSSKSTVSWTTDVPENAQINYGATPSLGNIAYDARGITFAGTTHYINISSLTSNATYYYDIVSGEVTYNNGGAHFTLTTAASLTPPGSSSDIVYGQVFLNDGSTPAEGAIVYVKLQDNDGKGTNGYSQLCTSLVGSTGNWSLQLINVRNQALTEYFVYSAAGDNLVLDAIGPGNGVFSQVVNTSSDTPAAPMTLGPPYWTLNMTEMNWYENTAPYNSTGAAACQMILNYIREGAGKALLTQDQIYEYGKAPATSGEMTPDEVDKALGHFDPYDSLVSNWSDSYDSLPDGNPYQGYNYSVDTYDPYLDTDAINKYMRDICHWMAYSVTKEDWWKDGALVARPNTPAAIPIYGSYANWVAVKGCVTSVNPCPEPHTNPWNTPDFAVYGFWMKDPRVSGIGQNTYKTAAECQSTYFLPLAIGDAYNKLFLQIAEPPAEISKADVEIPTPTADLANLDFIGAEKKGDGFIFQDKNLDKNEPVPFLMAGTASMKIGKPPVKKQSWRDLADPHLLTDPEAVAAFDGAKMGTSVFVDRTDGGADYYLVPFYKRVKGKNLVSAVMILDASAGYFKEASWTDKPGELLRVGKAEALWLIRNEIRKDLLAELNAIPKKPLKTYLLRQRELSRKYNQLLSKMRDADIALTWEPNSYSPSPYKPYWKINCNGYIWYVTQDGKVISEMGLDKILNELEANRIALQKFYN